MDRDARALVARNNGEIIEDGGKEKATEKRNADDPMEEERVEYEKGNYDPARDQLGGAETRRQDAWDVTQSATRAATQYREGIARYATHSDALNILYSSPSVHH